MMGNCLGMGWFHVHYDNTNVHNDYSYIVLSRFSNFIANDGGIGGTVSVAYVPLAFRGSSKFEANVGHSFVVSDVLLCGLTQGVKVYNQLTFLGTLLGSFCLLPTSCQQYFLTSNSVVKCYCLHNIHSQQSSTHKYSRGCMFSATEQETKLSFLEFLGRTLL